MLIKLFAFVVDKSSLLGGKKGYWNYVVECVGSNKSLNDSIKYVKSNNDVCMQVRIYHGCRKLIFILCLQLKTSVGRGRALIRFTLVHQRLADTVQQCVFNVAVTK